MLLPIKANSLKIRNTNKPQPPKGEDVAGLIKVGGIVKGGVRVELAS
jgi:hypothetical protein